MSEEMFYNLLLLFAEARSKIKRTPCQDMNLFFVCLFKKKQIDRRKNKNLSVKIRLNSHRKADR